VTVITRAIKNVTRCTTLVYVLDVYGGSEAVVAVDRRQACIRELAVMKTVHKDKLATVGVDLTRVSCFV